MCVSTEGFLCVCVPSRAVCALSAARGEHLREPQAFRGSYKSMSYFDDFEFDAAALADIDKIEAAACAARRAPLNNLIQPPPPTQPPPHAHPPPHQSVPHHHTPYGAAIAGGAAATVPRPPPPPLPQLQPFRQPPPPPAPLQQSRLPPPPPPLAQTSRTGTAQLHQQQQLPWAPPAGS